MRRSARPVMVLAAVLLATTLAWHSAVPAHAGDPAAAGEGADSISLGVHHTCGLKNGGVWCWGQIVWGQLGNGTTAADCSCLTTPVAVIGLTGGVSAVSAGDNHTCALKDGAVWCWGLNSDGQLGDGTTTGPEVCAGALACSSVPVAVSGLGSGVAAISAGQQHTCALKDGGVWCWGRNTRGQLGDGAITDSSVPVAVSGLGNGVSAISGGGSHTCAIKDGGIQCWGWNVSGQLGNGTITDSSVPVAVSGLGSGVSAISAGEVHTCALKDGGARCWGDNFFGELGDGTTTDSSVPIAVNGLGSGISAISAGQDYTCAVGGGVVYCLGHNSTGQLGNGTTTNSSVPVAVSGLGNGVSAISASSNDTCVLQGGAVRCWGYNGFGELGNGTLTDSHVPVTVLGLPASGVSAISAGGSHSCALKAGSAWCWGYNGYGQLGNGTTSGINRVPVAVTGFGSGVSAISASGNDTCALKDGAVKCWGSNYYGQLGNSTTMDSHVPVAVSGLGSGVTAISLGGYHTCALKDGGVWCWGLNRDGQLGNGTTTGPEVCGVSAYACSTAPLAVSGLGSGVSAITAGDLYTCALKDGAVRCWGWNGAGQFGNGTTTNSSLPVAAAGSLGSGVSAANAAETHTCALKDGGVTCWGSNGIGQLGDGTTADSSVPISVSSLTGGVSAISTRWWHTCALKDGGVRCWGYNAEGELGNGTMTLDGCYCLTTPVAVSGLGSGVSAISAGVDHSCALRNGGASCWGMNNEGQLGDGTTTNSSVPVPVVFPSAVGGISEAPDQIPLPSRTSTSLHDHRIAYGLAAIVAALALAVASAGALWRRKVR